MEKENHDYIVQLLVKYLQETISPDEQQELDRWLTLSDDNQRLFENINNTGFINTALKQFSSYDTDRGWDIIKQALPLAEKEAYKNTKWLKVAATVMVLCTIGVLLYFLNDPKSNTAPPIAQSKDTVYAPDVNRAVLSFENGNKIYLDTVNTGTALNLGNVQLTKTADGEIVYKVLDISAAAIPVKQTLSNPSGSKVMDVYFPDGTKTWLNAGSSISFAVPFTGKERRVALKGEAYFEVAALKMNGQKQPFIVEGKEDKAQWTVEVLGTRFNVNAYENEAETKVTLIEGSVHVKELDKQTSLVLKPGKQAAINHNDKTVSEKDVDANGTIAWKNSVFVMEDLDVASVMRKIARWYDVEVSYPDGVPEARFSGDIPANMSLPKVLEVLELSGIKCNVAGRKIIVLK